MSLHVSAQVARRAESLHTAGGRAVVRSKARMGFGMAIQLFTRTKSLAAALFFTRKGPLARVRVLVPTEVS